MDDFADFMTDTITVEPLASRDAYGTPTYGAAVSYPCRIDGATKQTVNVNGTERSIAAMVYVMGIPGIGPMDRLTMPAGYDPAQPPILRVSPLTDETGAHHTEVALGDATRRAV